LANYGVLTCVLPETLVAAPRCIEDVLDVRARPHLTIGDSFQTDGTQLVVPYRTLTTKRQFWKREARAKRVAAAANRDAKLAAYHDQKARLAGNRRFRKIPKHYQIYIRARFA
jgi:hypothetical protein